MPKELLHNACLLQVQQPAASVRPSPRYAYLSYEAVHMCEHWPSELAGPQTLERGVGRGAAERIVLFGMLRAGGRCRGAAQQPQVAPGGEGRGDGTCGEHGGEQRHGNDDRRCQSRLERARLEASQKQLPTEGVD